MSETCQAEESAENHCHGLSPSLESLSDRSHGDENDHAESERKTSYHENPP